MKYHSMSEEHHAPATESSTIHTSGCVKWFNNRNGYGFVTVSSGEHSGEDIFAHHSNIQVSKEQYKYLVQGEYVEFDLTEADSGDHKWTATGISGINGGKLMCETRNESRAERREHSDGAQPRPRRGGGERQPRQSRRGTGPREVVDEDGTEWRLVQVQRRGGQNGGGSRRGQRPRYDDEY
jgi:cold shock CspA family protein